MRSGFLAGRSLRGEFASGGLGRIRRGARALALISAFGIAGFCGGASRVWAQNPAPSPANRAAPPAGLAPSSAKSGGAVGAESPLTVTTRVRPEAPRVGDIITLELNVAYPRGYSVNLPTGEDFAPLHLVDTASEAEASTGQGLRRRFVVSLQAFALKNAQIPGFELTYVDPQKAVHTYKVAAIPLSMQSLTVNEAEPERKGEDPPVSPEYPNERAELAIYATLIGVLLGGILYALWRWRSTRPQLAPPAPVIPADVKAIAKLDRLQEQLDNLFEEGAGVLFYLELTETAKRYLGERFSVDCLDRTTDEIELRLMREPQLFGSISADDLRRFLRDCDLVKFARVATDKDQGAEYLQQVRAWVEQTRPQAQDESAAESVVAEQNKDSAKDFAVEAGGAGDGGAKPAASPREAAASKDSDVRSEGGGPR